jgi:G3E family GTPase
MWKKDKAPIVPVTVLTGFLGSGKTTLMNRILNDTTHGMRFAIIENEFGQVGVDDKVISENVDEEVIEVINGCICCTVRGDLVEALKKLHKRVEQFNGIIIETTGLADPAPVVQTFFVDEEIQKCYKLDSVITVVDAKHILTRLYDKKPEGAENEAVEQVVFADKILLNKVDLMANDDATLLAIEKELRALNPTAPILRTEHGQVSPAELLNIGAFDLKRVLDFDPEFLDENQEHQHDSSVTSFGEKTTDEFNIEMFQRWIQRLIEEDGANLYRYKGIIAVKGMNQKFVFQGVGMLFSGGFQGKWKKKEVRESRFIFIGKNLDTEFLKSGLDACRVGAVLRFAIGDNVLANVGSWKKGEIIKHWDDGNAYRIKLNDSSNVWAPVDIDEYVRAVAA